MQEKGIRREDSGVSRAGSARVASTTAAVNGRPTGVGSPNMDGMQRQHSVGQRYSTLAQENATKWHTPDVPSSAGSPRTTPAAALKIGSTFSVGSPSTVRGVQRQWSLDQRTPTKGATLTFSPVGSPRIIPAAALKSGSALSVGSPNWLGYEQRQQSNEQLTTPIPNSLKQEVQHRKSPSAVSVAVIQKVQSAEKPSATLSSSAQQIHASDDLAAASPSAAQNSNAACAERDIGATFKMEDVESTLEPQDVLKEEYAVSNTMTPRPRPAQKPRTINYTAPDTAPSGPQPYSSPQTQRSPSVPPPRPAQRPGLRVSFTAANSAPSSPQLRINQGSDEAEAKGSAGHQLDRRYSAGNGSRVDVRDIPTVPYQLAKKQSVGLRSASADAIASSPPRSSSLTRARQESGDEAPSGSVSSRQGNPSFSRPAAHRLSLVRPSSMDLSTTVGVFSVPYACR